MSTGGAAAIPPPLGEGDREAVEGAWPLRKRWQVDMPAPPYSYSYSTSNPSSLSSSCVCSPIRGG
jgi:hypothetical protein